MENEPIGESSTAKSLILRWPIGVKLIIAFLTLAIIPMSVTVTFNLAESSSEVAKVARENLVELSRSSAERIEGLLVENQRTSATLAGESGSSLRALGMAVRFVLACPGSKNKT